MTDTEREFVVLTEESLGTWTVSEFLLCWRFRQRLGFKRNGFFRAIGWFIKATPYRFQSAAPISSLLCLANDSFWN